MDAMIPEDALRLITTNTLRPRWIAWVEKGWKINGVTGNFHVEPPTNGSGFPTESLNVCWTATVFEVESAWGVEENTAGVLEELFPLCSTTWSSDIQF